MSAGSNGSVIEVDGLTKYYGGRSGAPRMVRSPSMPGEIFGFLDQNGAGKSTTSRLLLGFINPTAGDAHLLAIPHLLARPGLGLLASVRLDSVRRPQTVGAGAVFTLSIPDAVSIDTDDERIRDLALSRYEDVARNPSRGGHRLGHHRFPVRLRARVRRRERRALRPSGHRTTAAVFRARARPS